MKVMIIGAESFLGIQAITRFYREHYRVVGVYQSNETRYFSSVPHSKYVCNNTNSFHDLFISEKPDILVYTRINKVDNLEDVKEKVNEMTTLAELSNQFQTRKFIYLSGMDVYGEQAKTEDAQPEPISINGKTHWLCENTVRSFRTSAQLFNVFLRLPEVSGLYDTLDHLSVVFQMIDQAKQNSKITTGLEESYYLLDAGDAVEAILCSVNDSVDGIYNITTEIPISGIGLAAAIAMELPDQEGQAVLSALPVEIGLETTNKRQILGRKANLEMGFIIRRDTTAVIQACLAWYRDFAQTAVTEKPRRKRQNGALFRTIENTVIFLLLAFLTHIQSGYTDMLSTQYLTIYIILVSVSFGISQGIVAAVLVSGYYVFESVSAGYSLTATFSNLNVLLQMVQNLVIAMCIGYVFERKNYTIEEKERRIELLDRQISDLRQINNDLGRIKNEQETRILKYESGLGKLYASIKELNTLSKQDVFWGTLTMIRDITGEKNISLYLRQPDSNYMRQFLFTGQTPKKFPKSVNILSNEALFEIVQNNLFYTNNYLNPNMPSVILPIAINQSVVVLVMIEDMKFEKLTLYSMNILHIVKDLLNDVYRNANIYENLVSQFAFEGSTNIMLAKELQKAIQFAQRGFENSGIEFVMIEFLADETQEMSEVTKKARRFLRDTDEIGRLPAGGVGALLLNTSSKDAENVLERLKKNEITAKIIKV